MRKNIYLAICEKLTELKNNNGQNLIQHFDLWNNNVQFIEEEMPFNTPAVFVEFAPIQWKYYPNRTREAVIRLRLHVVTRKTAPTDTNSQYLNESLNFLDLLDNIQNLLSGHILEGTNPLTPVASTTNHNHNELFNCIEEFDLHVIDKQAVKELNKIPAGNLKIVIEK
jgi:hypothetical protein